MLSFLRGHQADWPATCDLPGERPVVSVCIAADDTHPLFCSAVLELTSAGGLGGGTVEVTDATGMQLAAADREGAITAPDGRRLLRAPVRFEGRRSIGTNAGLEVFDAEEAPLGQVHVTSYSVTPRTRKMTLSMSAPGGELFRLAHSDKRGEEAVITVGERPIATMRKTGKRGFIRTSTAYRLELTSDLDLRSRQLLVAAVIRYDALMTEAATASRSKP